MTELPWPLAWALLVLTVVALMVAYGVAAAIVAWLRKKKRRAPQGHGAALSWLSDPPAASRGRRGASLWKEKQMNDGQAQGEMPRYKCHKEVWALKIAAIDKDDKGEPNTETSGGAMITPAEEGYASFWVDLDYMRKHQPEVGGYYVVHKDGYKSFSPAQAFEEGYARI